MNRKELVAAVADGADLEQKTVDAVLRSLQSTLEGAAAKGEKVSVPGFFALSVGQRAAREGRNPATGETIQIPAAKTVKFTAGSALKDAAKASSTSTTTKARSLRKRAPGLVVSGQRLRSTRSLSATASGTTTLSRTLSRTSTAWVTASASSTGSAPARSSAPPSPPPGRRPACCRSSCR